MTPFEIPVGGFGPRTDVRYMTRAQLFTSARQFMLTGILMAGATLVVGLLVGRGTSSVSPLILGLMFLCFVLAAMGFAGAIYAAARAFSRSTSYDPVAVWRADRVAWLAAQSDMGIRRAIELHDSSVTEVESKDGVLVVWMDACVHRSNGEPGRDPGNVSLHRAELRIDAGRSEGGVPALPAEVLGGTLSLGAAVFSNVITVPMARRESVRLEFELEYGQSLVVLGEGLTVTLMDEGRYLNEFPGLG